MSSYRTWGFLHAVHKGCRGKVCAHCVFMRWECLVNFKYNEDLGIWISAYKFWGFLHTDSGGLYIQILGISTYTCWLFLHVYSCVWGTSTYRTY